MFTIFLQSIMVGIIGEYEEGETIMTYEVLF